MKVMVDPKSLKKGMYVAELDRPWLDSPFLFQGFRITNTDELEQLAEICEYVFVDSEKSIVPVSSQLSIVPTRTKKQTSKASNYIKRAEPYQTTFEQEYPRAREIYNIAHENAVNLYSDARIGKSLRVAEVKYTVSSLVDSVMRHPDALMLLSTLREKSDRSVGHAVNVCALSVTFGRFLGFNKQQLMELGAGALLHDIGETKIPDDILENFGRCSPEEIRRYQDHTTYGAAILHNSKGLPDSVISIARDHHERANGSGYPQHLQSEQLHLYTTIVSIVDVYDSVTSGLYGMPAIACTDALKNIYAWREDFFDHLLVEKFIQCLGIYPLGSVVELRSGYVGIVISINPETRLLPKILLVRDQHKKPVEPPKIINLSLFLNSKNKPLYEIANVARAEQYAIDVRNYLLQELPFKAA